MFAGTGGTREGRSFQMAEPIPLFGILARMAIGMAANHLYIGSSPIESSIAD